MFPNAALAFLVLGALSVNAFSVPVARSPIPEPESHELEAWLLKRDLSYELFSREPQNHPKPISQNSFPVLPPQSPDLGVNGPIPQRPRPRQGR